MLRTLLTVLLALTLAKEVNAANIPVETFFKFPDITSVRISPDGKHIASVVRTDGDTKLAILDLKNMKVKTIFDFAREKQEIGTYGWLNNSRIFASMVQKVGPLAQPRPTGYLFAGNIDGKKKTQLLPAKTPIRGRDDHIPKSWSFLNFLRNDDEHVLISMSDGLFTSAYTLNVYSGRKKKVEKSPSKYAQLIADHKGNVTVSISRDKDGTKQTIHMKANEKADWKVFKEFDAKKVGVSLLGFTKDNKQLFAEVSDKENIRGIYTLDLSTKKLSLIRSLKGDTSLQSTIVDRDFLTPEIIGFKRMPGYIETEYFDQNHFIAKIHRSLNKSFPNEEVEIVNYTSDGKTAVVLTHSEKNPGSYYLFDMENFKLSFMLKTYPWIDRNKMASMKPFSFKARDGLEIRGYLTQPNNIPTNAPMVVMVHGGPYGVKDNWAFNSEVQFLANRGYAVLQVNFRGSGGRGNEFIFDSYKKVGSEMQDDLTDATLWAVEKGYADKNRICIYGASYGGYAAMMGVIREPELYKCSIPYVGVYDIRAMKYDIYHKTKSGRRNAKESWGYGDEKFMAARSPVDNVDKIKAALFLVHGKDDPICPIEHYDALTDALDKRNYPYESLVKEYEGHGFRLQKNRFQLYKKMEQFLDKHIGVSSLN